MKSLFTLLAFVMTSLPGMAQNNRVNNWYFGQYAAIDFNSGVPIALSNSAMTQHEGCSSISDANGNLLFYTDGVSVYNSLHSLMPNGTGLYGHLTSTQSALIVPRPGNPTQYYIFTIAGYGLPVGLSYSIVDMTLDNGNGDVINKNTALLDSVPLTEKLAATLHANGQDVWIAVHELNMDVFYSYQVTPQGIAGPFISTAGSAHTGVFAFIGYMKFSPSGNKVAVGLYGTPEMDLLDFDNTSGLFSNAATFTGPGDYTYGVEFSKTASKLYATHASGTNTLMFQFDMNAGSNAAIVATGTVVHTTAGAPGAIQLGPDGKIYISQYLSNWLGCIQSPELPGVACDVVTSAVSLGTSNRICKLGLPNFISNYFSEVTASADMQDPAADHTVHPNPFINQLTITGPSIAGEHVNFTLTDSKGKVVFHSSLLGAGNRYAGTLTLPPLSKGVYFATVVSNGKTYRHKLIRIQ